jgi:hypothetical protein
MSSSYDIGIRWNWYFQKKTHNSLKRFKKKFTSIISLPARCSNSKHFIFWSKQYLGLNQLALLAQMNLGVLDEKINKNKFTMIPSSLDQING